MSVKVAEVGKTVNLATGLDLSSSTSMTITTTSPSGVSGTIATGRITAPAPLVVDPILGTLAANTYMQFTTEATDFTESGTWTVCGTYTDATPKVFFGDDATFTVGDKC